MSVRITDNVVSLRDKTTGKLLPIAMFGSGADKTLEEIKNYADYIQRTTKKSLDNIESVAKTSATNTLNEVINDANAKIQEAETRRTAFVNSITSMFETGTDNSLTVNGAAADSGMTGDHIRKLEDEMIMSPQLFNNDKVTTGIMRVSNGGIDTIIQESTPTIAYHNTVGIDVRNHAGETVYFSADGVAVKALYVVCEIKGTSSNTFTEISDTDNYTIPTNANRLFVSFSKDYLSKFQVQYNKVTKLYPYDQYITKIMIEDMSNEIAELRKMIQSLMTK